jgi:hypothetical protein
MCPPTDLLPEKDATIEKDYLFLTHSVYPLESIGQIKLDESTIRTLG